MANYKVIVQPSAGKELREIMPRDKQRLLDKLFALAEEPRLAGAKKLKGEDNWYRLRQGDYRAIDMIDNQHKELPVTRVRHRREAYR